MDDGVLNGEWLVAATAVTAAVMVAGLLAVIVPIVPGLAIIWVAAIVYGVLVGFSALGWGVVVILTVLLIISVAAGVVIPRRAAAESGASGWSQLSAVVGGIIGFFVIPVVGLIIGALAGLLLTERALKGSWDEAWTATKGAAKGFGISALVDLGLGTVMIALWSLWAATVLL